MTIKQKLNNLDSSQSQYPEISFLTQSRNKQTDKNFSKIQ